MPELTKTGQNFGRRTGKLITWLTGPDAWEVPTTLEIESTAGTTTCLPNTGMSMSWDIAGHSHAKHYFACWLLPTARVVQRFQVHCESVVLPVPGETVGKHTSVHPCADWNDWNMLCYWRHMLYCCSDICWHCRFVCTSDGHHQVSSITTVVHYWLWFLYH